MRYSEFQHLLTDQDIEWIDHIEGIDYYLHGDEEWGCVVAVDHEARLAIETTFYEMDDFYPLTIEGKQVRSDYQIVNDNGRLCCEFERSK